MANITDKRIDELPVATSVGDSDLFVVEQGGVAKSIEGSVIRSNFSQEVDDALSSTSENPVQNKVVKAAMDGKLYRVVQAHTSQADWMPNATPALYTEVAKPGEIPVWRQPTGAQDAYMKGDKVHYPDADSFVYESLIDNNVWSPDEHPAGWSKEL